MKKLGCSDGGAGFAPVGSIGGDDGEVVEAEVGHGARDCSDVEGIARGDEYDVDGIGVSLQETIVVGTCGSADGAWAPMDHFIKANRSTMF